MIVVTGATGQLGSQVVEHLLTRTTPDQLGVSVRDPAKAQALADRGVRVRQGDFTDPATLRHAFAGADQVLVVSAAIRGPGAAAANTAAIDAARAAGVRRVVYTSHQAASRDSLFAAQPTHAATEEHLAAAGLPFTALRNGFYATTLGYYTRGAVETGRFVTPEDGPVSWTAHADLAEVAAIALTQEGVLDGVSAPLTAPVALDFDDVARELSELSGRQVEHVTVGDEEWAATAIAQGMPAAAAEFSLGIFRAARRGEFDVTDPTLERLLGRSATPARAVLQQLVPAT
jgi:NAD(P)H dehydrogenase (quinone)